MANFDLELDACGLNCPLPVLKVRKSLLSMTAGQRLHLIATDIGAKQDIPAFANMTGNLLISQYKRDNELHFIIEKGS